MKYLTDRFWVMSQEKDTVLSLMPEAVQNTLMRFWVK